MERRNPFRVAHQIREGSLIPRVAKAQPWAEIREHLRGCPSDPSGIAVPRVAKAQPWAEIREHLRCCLAECVWLFPGGPKAPSVKFFGTFSALKRLY